MGRGLERKIFPTTTPFQIARVLSSLGLFILQCPYYLRAWHRLEKGQRSIRHRDPTLMKAMLQI